MKGLYRSIDIAGWLANKGIDTKLYLSNLTVNKLAYFAHGYFYRQNSENILIVERSFYTWKLGPVSPEVYYKYKEYASSHIDKKIAISEIAPNILDYLHRFWTGFVEKHNEPVDLIYLSHIPKGAWDRSTQEGKDIIPEEYIKDEFTRL